MAYQVLARKYRPQHFSDVVGQDHVTRTLLNALVQNRIAHGYIFSGHRGIGKTTIARILASALNCRSAIGAEPRPTAEPCGVCESCIEIRQGNAVDVIEIDAATNRGIDEIRELREGARYRPSRDKYKIYILDEAHQITDAAFNALLKTLEEPPEHIVFMMATTQPEDIPQTIRSRCQHFSFHAVKFDDILGQLRRIAGAEHILAGDAALSLLAEAGDGSMRDALSIMDQAIASAPSAPAAPGEPAGPPALEVAQIRELMGSVSNAVYEQILEAVHANNSAEVLNIAGRLIDAGNGAPQLARQFVRYLRNAVVAKITHLAPGAAATGIAADLLQISPEERNRAARSAALFIEEELSRFLSIMLRTFDDLGYRQEQRFHFELGLLKLVHMQRLVPIEDLLSQLGAKPGAHAAAPRSTPASTATAPVPAAGWNAGTSAAERPSDGRSARPGTAAGSSGAAGSSTPFPSALEADRARRFPSVSSSPVSPATGTEGSLALAGHHPVPDSEAVAPQQAVRPRLILTPPETAPAAAGELAAPEIAPRGPSNAAVPGERAEPASLDLASLQSSLVAALAAVKGQQSASEQIEDATFSLEGDSILVQTTLSGTMLPVIFNADAERILQAALRARNLNALKLRFLPGAPAAPGAPRKTRSAAIGSAAELAEKHPIVQQAKRIFSADVSNVIDLRGKD